MMCSRPPSGTVSALDYQEHVHTRCRRECRCGFFRVRPPENPPLKEGRPIRRPSFPSISRVSTCHVRSEDRSSRTSALLRTQHLFCRDANQTCGRASADSWWDVSTEYVRGDRPDEESRRGDGVILTPTQRQRERTSSRSAGGSTKDSCTARRSTPSLLLPRSLGSVLGTPLAGRESGRQPAETRWRRCSNRRPTTAHSGILPRGADIDRNGSLGGAASGTCHLVDGIAMVPQWSGRDRQHCPE